MEEEKMDYKKLAERILEKLGGKENVESVVHCMTRLRFVLKDESQVDDEQVKKIKGVIGVMKKVANIKLLLVMKWRQFIKKFVRLVISKKKHRQKK